MRLPVQSPPVPRSPDDIHADLKAHRVSPSGDCGTGYYCCNRGLGPTCVKCYELDAGGHCYRSHTNVCKQCVGGDSIPPSKSDGC